MENFFKKFVLAPYILKATALIGVQRRCGGNQFRHQFATLGILIDYKYFDLIIVDLVWQHSPNNLEHQLWLM